MKGEYEVTPRSGWLMLVVGVLGFFLSIVGIISAGISLDKHDGGTLMVGLLVISIMGVIASVLTLVGLVVVPPNTASVLLLFGKYLGTVKVPGLRWVNPFTKRTKVSLRTRNMTTPTMKVNDVRGNPIEIGAVVVWRVHDTYKSSFDVEDFKGFVDVQSESALRHLASIFPYDTVTGTELSLRGSMEEVNKALTAELNERVQKAGVVVEESRLSHLAYAPEIAGAMLRRQQAEAVVSARTKIVEGAVGMVEIALEHLERGGKVRLDDERRAAMVSNLMVVLCGDQNVSPIVNTGTLYSG